MATLMHRKNSSRLLHEKPSQRKEKFISCAEQKRSEINIFNAERTHKVAAEHEKIASQHFCLPLSSPITLVYILYSCGRKGGEAA